VADCIAADVLLDHIAAAEILHGDKGYDSDAVRRKIESKGAAPNIPPKVNRRWKNCFSPYLYRNRNAIERMFGRLKDFRRIATRYDRLAQNWTPPKTVFSTRQNGAFGSRVEAAVLSSGIGRRYRFGPAGCGSSLKPARSAR
jgi:transposase